MGNPDCEAQRTTGDRVQYEQVRHILGFRVSPEYLEIIEEPESFYHQYRLQPPKETTMANEQLDNTLQSIASTINSLDKFPDLDFVEKAVRARRTQLKTRLINEHIPLYDYIDYFDEDGVKQRGFCLQHHQVSVTVRTPDNERVNVPFERIGSLGLLAR